MYSTFLSKVRGLAIFEATHGVPPRTTALGFSLPDYGQDDAGMTLWEHHYGVTAQACPGSTPFSVLSNTTALPSIPASTYNRPTVCLAARAAAPARKP